MADRKLFSLSDVRSLAMDSEIWHSKVTGFGARRQRRAAVSYVLLYRTEKGRQRQLIAPAAISVDS
jgi:hypothetical protein